MKLCTINNIAPTDRPVTANVGIEAERSSDSTALAALLSSFQPQKTTLAHIRFATVGTVKPENCHPFTAADISGRVWTMIHNGTIYSGEQTYRYLSKQGGDTDSERLFLSLIDKINQRLIRGRLTERERFALISDSVSENSPRQASPGQIRSHYSIHHCA